MLSSKRAPSLKLCRNLRTRNKHLFSKNTFSIPGVFHLFGFICFGCLYKLESDPSFCKHFLQHPSVSGSSSSSVNSITVSVLTVLVLPLYNVHKLTYAAQYNLHTLRFHSVICWRPKTGATVLPHQLGFYLISFIIALLAPPVYT